jgi:hypothetical protein
MNPTDRVEAVEERLRRAGERYERSNKASSSR